MPVFAPFDYGQAVGQGTQNAMAQLNFMQQADPNSLRNQLAREQLEGARQQNMLAARQQTMAEQKFNADQQMANTRWLYNATSQVLQNPELLPTLARAAQSKGIISSDANVDSFTIDDVRNLNQQLSLEFANQEMPQQDLVQSTQILANGNIGYLTRGGRLVDTGQKASETYQIRDIAGSVVPVSTRTGRAAAPLATAGETSSAEADKQAAVKISTEIAKQKADQVGQQKSNQAALEVYDASMSGLVNALGGTTTGPGMGLIPAITTNQQIADGAVAAMAPALKQMFRAAGEGTFTDADQKILMGMIPTRNDTPEARLAKISNIDAIVRAKLGQGVQMPERMRQPQSAPTRINSDAEYNALPSGAEFIAPDGSRRRKP